MQNIDFMITNSNYLNNNNYFYSIRYVFHDSNHSKIQKFIIISAQFCYMTKCRRHLLFNLSISISYNTNFKPYLLHSKNNIDIKDELDESKGRLACLYNAKIFQIHETSKISKSFVLKETYKCPSIKTLHQRYSIICINLT